MGPPEQPVPDERYEVLEELGRGGMAVVYRAVDRQLQRPVALKVLLRDDSEHLRLRFLREAQTLARFHHPNLVTVHDAGESGGRAYLVMELIAGRPFDVARPLRTAVPILRKVALALEEAHRHGVVHRDLKPANILVDAQDEPHVVDFGLAHLADTQVRLTRTGSALGTPLYMAPEQVSGRPELIGPATDVYAMGAILYEVLAKRPPHPGETAADVYERILVEDPPPPPGPPDLATIAMKALEKHPRNRYATAGAFAEDLRRWLDGEPVAARPPGSLRRLARRLLRHRTSLAAAAGALVLASIGVAVIAAAMRARSFRESAAEARRAFDAGDWARALAECDRASRIRPDASLESIARACRERLAGEEARRRLREEMRPIERLIHDTRPLFYVPNVDVGAKLAKIADALDAFVGRAREFEEARDPELWTALGMGWYFIGDMARAEQALSRAAALAPDDGRANFYLARLSLERSVTVLLRHGRTTVDDTLQDLARRHAARAQELMARTSRAWADAEEIDRAIVRAYRLLADGDGLGLQQFCEESIARFGSALGSEEFWMLQSWAIRGDGKDAYCERALARRPHYPWALFVRGNTWLDLGDARRALEDFEAAVRLSPRWAQARVNRAAARKLLGDTEGALADLTEAARLDPDYPEAFYNRAVIRHETADFDGARADLDACLRLRPDFASAWQNRGALHADRGELDLALANLDEAVRLAPGSATALYNRALVRRRMGDLPGALADFDASIRVADNAEHRSARGAARAAAGDARGAMEDFDEAIRLDPSCAAAWVNRGSLKRDLGDAAGGLADLDESIRRRPTAEGHYNRGLTKLRAGAFEAAIEDFTAAATLNPRLPQIFNNRGVARYKLRDLKGAIEDLGEAIRLKPDDAGAYTNRGLMRAEAGDPKGAIEDLDEAIRLSPREAAAHVNRGLARQATGDLRGAAADFERAIELAPAGHPGRRQAEEMLEAVRRKLGQ